MAYLLPLALLFSCIKDLKELETIDSINYLPSFSVPVGSLSYTLEDIMPPDSLWNYEIPDSLLQAGDLDTLILIYNDTRTFFRPELGYTAYFHEPVSLRTIFEQSENVEHAMIKTIIKNNIPVSIEVQGYLLDDNDQVVDSLIHSGKAQIPAPNSNGEGIIDEPTEETIYTHYYASQVDDLMNVTEIRVYVHLDTYTEDVDTLKVYSWNGIELEIGLRGDLIIPITP